MTYSRMVAWLKILLPLTALAILSTLFLLARPGNQVSSLPFAKIELEEKLRNQGITQPFFSGQTTGGDLISFKAETARPDPDAPRKVNARAVDVEISMISGDTAFFTAGDAIMDTEANHVDLTGQVQISSTSGFDVQTASLSVDLLNGMAMTDETLTGTAPFGSFKAGAMRFSGDSSKSQAQFHFNKGVKLIYTPRTHTR